MSQLPLGFNFYVLELEYCKTVIDHFFQILVLDRYKKLNLFSKYYIDLVQARYSHWQVLFYAMGRTLLHFGHELMLILQFHMPLDQV